MTFQPRLRISVRFFVLDFFVRRTYTLHTLPTRPRYIIWRNIIYIIHTYCKLCLIISSRDRIASIGRTRSDYSREWGKKQILPADNEYLKLNYTPYIVPSLFQTRTSRRTHLNAANYLIKSAPIPL